MKEGSTRPVNRTYYYLNYRATIDMIKYKILTISKRVQGSTIPEQERKEFFCNRCKTEYTALDVAGLVPTVEGMECDKCGAIVVDNPNTNTGGHVKSTAWTSQIAYIMDLLQKIDQVVIPENPFEKAYADALPVMRSETNPGTDTAPIETTLNRPTAVKGLKDTGPKSMSVVLTATNGPTEADIAAEAAKKRALAAANALPEFFVKSTVSGDLHRLAKDGTSIPSIAESADIKPKTDSFGTGTSTGGGIDDITDYFEALKQHQLAEAQKEAEEEDESDDEDEFEDVLPAGNAGASGSAVGTPASSNGVDSPSKRGLPILAGVLKNSKSREGSQSNSGTSTGVTSPTGAQTPDGERAMKKVRIEEPVKMKEEVDSEEEDLEFEDV